MQYWISIAQVFIKGSLKQVVEVIVDVLDVNEFPPRFPTSYIRINISENSEIDDVIPINEKFLAVDADSGNCHCIIFDFVKPWQLPD